MPRLKRRPAPVLLVLCTCAALALLGAPALATPIRAALHRCSSGRVSLGLDVVQAEGVSLPAPAGAGSARSVVAAQIGEARGGERGLCPSAARRSIQAGARRLLSLYRHHRRAQARRLLRRLIAAIHSSAHQAKAPAPVARAAGGCSFDGTRHVSMSDAVGVADDLAVAQAALFGGDDAGATRALDAASAAYQGWVQGGAGGAQSVGDWIGVAAGAQLLGLEGVADGAIEHARTAARAALEQAKQLDACSGSSNDAPCLAKALTLATMLGIDTPADTEALVKLLEADGERAEGKTPNGCEQWTLTVEFKASSGTTLRWGPGSFRVDRRAGTIVDAPGKGAGWPGELGADEGPCLEEGVQVGTGSYPPVPFHFSISGSVTSLGFALTLASSEAHISITVSGPPACQGLGALAEAFVNPLLSSLPLELPVAAGQTSVDMSAPGDEGSSMSITAQRTS